MIGKTVKAEILFMDNVGMVGFYQNFMIIGEFYL